MEKDTGFNTEINVYQGGMVNVANETAQINVNTEVNQNTNIQHEVKSRTQEYADKWDMNMFLNDFKEWDENAGVNVKLSDVYLEDHLPHFKWKNNNDIAKKNNKPVSIKKELSKYINVLYISILEKKMLLILGQPGIGKSTLITWITANFKDRKDNILIYQFATDLKSIDWANTDKDSRLADDIIKKLNLTYESLNGKTLIIDGFDEISVRRDRADILNRIYWQLVQNRNLKNFSLIITCREHYIENLQKLSCDYITLQPWDEDQIKSFCIVYSNKAGIKISEKTIINILKNNEVLGIPLILYMVFALNISIDEENSIVDVYDKIFALEGGIYDRCIDNANYAGPHIIISEIKRQIHQISREIAFWMFEHEPDKASILYKDYQKICDTVVQDSQQKKETMEQDFLIGNFFKKIRHCEGIETEEISFVHRTIYEYFVAEMIYNSIEEAMIELSDESQKRFAGNIAWFLKQRELSYTITEYLKHKIFKLYNKLDVMKRKNFYQWWENAVKKMMTNGMFYYTKKNIQDFNNIMGKEVRCFLNLVKILESIYIVSEQKYIMSNIDRNILEKYIKHSSAELKYNKKLILNESDLSGINLSGVDLSEAELSGANLSRTNLSGANLSGAILWGANLYRADLRKAKLGKSELYKAKIEYSIFRKNDIQKIMKQLKEIDFEHIIIEDENGQQQVSKNELFPDLQ